MKKTNENSKKKFRENKKKTCKYEKSIWEKQKKFEQNNSQEIREKNLNVTCGLPYVFHFINLT